MTPELEAKYDRMLETDLSYAACAAAGIPENHLPIMRHERYKQILRAMPYAPEPGSFEWTARNRLASNAQSARQTVSRNPSLTAYYIKRQMVRDMGGNPDSVPRPEIRRGPPRRVEADELVVRPVDEWAQLEELAARPLHNVTGHRYGERGPEVRFERRQLHQENFEIREARRALAQRRRALEARARAGVAHKSPERQAELRVDRVSARGELARRSTWSEQALADLDACLRQGVATPVAARHPYGTVPLHLRGARFRHNLG